MATTAENKTMLANIETAINDILTGGAVQSYSTTGRSLSRIPFPDLLTLRERIQSELAGKSKNWNFAGVANAK